MKGLTPGRNVHYVTGTGKHLYAGITKVWHQSEEGEPDHATVNLVVFNPADGEHGEEVCWNKTSVPFDAEAKAPGSWHWIEPA